MCSLASPRLLGIACSQRGVQIRSGSRREFGIEPCGPVVVGEFRLAPRIAPVLSSSIARAADGP
jgi:hypothetical protein